MQDKFVKCGIKNTNAMNRQATELLKKYGFDRRRTGLSSLDQDERC